MHRLRSWTRPDALSLIFLFLALILLIFIFSPIIRMCFSSSPGTLWDTLLEDDVYFSILLTLWSGLVAVFFGLLFGVPLAYLLARHSFRGKRLVESLIDLPIVIPHSAAGIALLFVFGRIQPFGKLFGHLNIGFHDAVAGVVIAMMFVSIPFLIDSARDGFKSVDVRLEKVSRTLGASPWRTFLFVSLPLAWRSILSGSIMMWARAISEFGAIVIIAYHAPFLGEHPMVAPVLVWYRFANYGLDSSRPVAVLVILISLVLFVGLRTLTTRERKT